MFNPEIDIENVITITEADLKEEQKQAMENAMEDYRQLYLKSFSLNRSGEVIHKQDLSLPRHVTFDSNPGKLQEMVNSAINHALINHSNVLSNTVYNVVVQSFKEGQAPSLYVGPAYHLPGLASVSAPSAPSLRVEKLLLLQFWQVRLMFNLHQWDQIQRFQKDEFNSIQIYRHQLCQGSRLPQVSDAARKALVPSAPPVLDQYMIGCGADSVYMKGLVSVLAIF